MNRQFGVYLANFGEELETVAAKKPFIFTCSVSTEAPMRLRVVSNLDIKYYEKIVGLTIDNFPVYYQVENPIQEGQP